MQSLVSDCNGQGPEPDTIYTVWLCWYVPSFGKKNLRKDCEIKKLLPGTYSTSADHPGCPLLH